MHLTKQVMLDKHQINKLMQQKSIITDDDEILQFHDGEIVLNSNGDIYYTEKVNFKFFHDHIENKWIVNDIKTLVCEYLNLQPSEVIFSSRSFGSFDFIIKFDGQHEWKICVCDFPTAVSNTAELSDDVPEAKCNDEVIGLYRKLGTSPYYFRWFNDI